MSKFVSFGELLLRLSPNDYDRFIQSQSFCATFGGAEANFAVALSRYGHDAFFVSKFPAHEIGEMAICDLNKYGVNTDYVARGGERMGIFFCEKGASQRPSKVIYDRKNASIATAKPEEFNWKEILKDAAWFHVSGITVALSEACRQMTLEAVKAAQEMGVMVSVDLNYRKKLWTSEQAGKAMTEIVKYTDVLVGNEEDADMVFGIKAPDTDVEGGKLHRAGYEAVAQELKHKFPNLKYVGITLRESISASENGWSGMLYDGEKSYLSKKYLIKIVDRIGGGDSFCSGLAYALEAGYAPQDAVEFAVAASCLKQTINFDYNLITVDEVKALAGGDASGRVQR